MRNPAPSVSRHGFTLLELSIVLVIIGLIVGGILVGQSLIKSSELNSVITDRSRFSTAMVNFKTKYFAYPGDLSNATSFWTASATCPDGSTGTCNGDGDGRISNSSWTNANEMYRMWQHLTLAGMVNGQYTGVPASTTLEDVFDPGRNFPKSRMRGVYTIFFNTAPFAGQTARHEMRNYGASPSVGTMTADEMFEIDNKADDGKPGKGAIYTDFTTFPNCVSTNNPATADYLVSNTTFVECVIRLDVD